MLQPLRDRLIVRRDPVEDKIGDIYVPDNAKEPPKKGTVVAIGPGYRAPENGIFIETTLKPGDRIMFGPYVGVEVGMTNEEGEDEVFLVLREEEVLGTLHDEPEPAKLSAV